MNDDIKLVQHTIKWCTCGSICTVCVPQFFMFTTRSVLFLGLPELFNNVNEAEDVNEGTPFSFNIQNTVGFPFDAISYQWFYNRVAMTEGGSNPNTTQYPNITFSSVSRTDSGNYSIEVNHEGGIVNGSFQLNVQC